MKRAYLAAAVSAALAFAGAAGTACATDLSWQGGTGNLMDPNYTDGTNPNLTPTSADTAAIGANGIASNASGDQTVGRLFVGHTLAANPGDGTVNITGGSVSTTLGKSGRANAGVIIGNGANVTLSI
jgi:hypothetical protein